MLDQSQSDLSSYHHTAASTFIQAAAAPAKTKEPLSLQLLEERHIDAILELEEKVHESLSGEEKAFLLAKDRDWFEDHFEHQGEVVGVFSGDNLVGLSVITDPTPEYPQTGMYKTMLPAPLEKLTILSAVQVDPEYRNLGVMAKMIDFWIDHAAGKGRTHAMARIATANCRSWSAFMKKGLHLVGLEPRPSGDGTLVYNAIGHVAELRLTNAASNFNQLARHEKVLCSTKDISMQKRLFENGFHAQAQRPDGKALLFTRKKGVAQAAF